MRVGGQVSLMLCLLGGKVASAPGLGALSLPLHGSWEKMVPSCLLAAPTPSRSEV